MRQLGLHDAFKGKAHLQTSSAVSDIAEENLSQENESHVTNIEETQRIVLNLCGMKFEITRDTLYAQPESFFGGLLRGGNLSKEVYINRDGLRFRNVLHFLRDGTVYITDVNELRGLREEARFFSLQELEDLCTEQIELYEQQEAATNKVPEMLQAVLEAVKAVLEEVKAGGDARRTKMRRMEPTFTMDEDF
eukprot:TRINITY_DN1594_c0_g2_i1.p1 TRINITY_DN1594_c0_g2~~TRINITY_DN1594_c0_g2_i1.p1  ORF type:complete len:192 (+),score=34.55 TRINITY_DN1594_c0_g2_i1:273-848(+)